ncbi:hypothetical protein BUALT_Bualt12G0101800 [Buddleja alternifolia]|uniref:Uncharacterized protein n=1 Tax=Buddleja alternifolia TaxID=168488 RepID=A0AAV6WRQ2_9LAMI|nr:hypothetical protein BUALT_Bualt12G0101800 [Buddleja alternifolia]
MAKSLIMPITKVNSSLPNESSPVKISCQKLQGTFSPKVYKLLEKSGYNFSNPSGLGKLEPELTGEKIHGLTKAQHKLRKQGYQVDQPKTGLGFTPVEPVRIRVTKKEKCVNVQHISIEGDGKGKKPSDNRVSVFDRLSTPTARPSVFGRLGSSSRIPNVQDRLGASSIPQSSVFNRLGVGSTQQPKKRNHAGETDMAGSRNNNQTLILSQPQGSKSSLVVITMDGTVKVVEIAGFCCCIDRRNCRICDDISWLQKSDRYALRLTPSSSQLSDGNIAIRGSWKSLDMAAEVARMEVLGLVFLPDLDLSIPGAGMVMWGRTVDRQRRWRRTPQPRPEKPRPRCNAPMMERGEKSYCSFELCWARPNTHVLGFAQPHQFIFMAWLNANKVVQPSSEINWLIRF